MQKAMKRNPRQRTDGLSEKISSMKFQKYIKQCGRCPVCGDTHAFDYPWQLAHKIPQRKWCIAYWGPAVIHHPDNMVLVDSLKCNQKAQINPNTLKAAKHAEAIRVRIGKRRKLELEGN